MRKWTLKRIGIYTFCLTLGTFGIFTLLINVKSIGKATLTGLRSGLNKGSINTALTTGISSFESSFSTNFFNKESFIDLYGFSENLLGKTYIHDVDTTYNIVKDNHDQLQFITYPTDSTTQINEIIELNQTLTKKNVPLLYVQAPLKVIDGFTALPQSIVDSSKTNTDTLLNTLEAGDVDTLDLRQAALEDEIDLSQMFYNTDHHWRTETAFWGVQKVVETLKTNYNLDLDPENFYMNKNNYTFKLYAQSFLGSQGRRVGRYFGGLDDYTLILPRYETDYDVTINTTDATRTQSGTFEEAIIDQDLLTATDVYTNRYASYFGADYNEVIINNKKSDNNLKVLIVKDSFALPFSAFLSTMVDETRLLDLRYFQGNLEDYVSSYNPDIVLYVYKSLHKS